MVKRIFSRLRRATASRKRAKASRKGSAAYWSVHMVIQRSFQSAEDSLRYFHWRNAQYPGYIELMPVSGQDGKVVMDYGCGPGNDLVGFTEYSKPKELYAVDVSKPALEAAQRRLDLHCKKATLVQVDEITNEIPLESNSVDYIHSSGVLHHCANLNAVLKEFFRILKPDGKIMVMVYNYPSIWVHLYVVYVLQLELGKFENLSVLEAFQHSTDGGNCPISNCYTPTQLLEIFQDAGFDGIFTGSYISLTELKYLERRFDAIGDERLPDEHREFLSNLRFNDRGLPLYEGAVAGIGGCYSFNKINS